MKRLVFLVAAIIPVVFVACENQESDRTTVQINFIATGNVSKQDIALRSSVGEGILIDTAIIILEKIDLKRQGSADTVYNPGEFLLRGPYEINLVSHTGIPEIPPAEITPGIYSLLQGLLFKPEGYSFNIYVSGTYTKETRWWRFVYSYDKSTVFQAKSRSGFEIAENSSNNIWIMIDVVALFDGVDFSHATIGTGNTIIINSLTNVALANVVGNNFEAAVEINTGTSNDSENDQASENDQDDETSDSGKVTGGNDDNKDKNKNKNKNKKKDKVKNKDKTKDKDKDKDKDDDDDNDDDDDKDDNDDTDKDD